MVESCQGGWSKVWPKFMGKSHTKMDIFPETSLLSSPLKIGPFKRPLYEVIIFQVLSCKPSFVATEQPRAGKYLSTLAYPPKTNSSWNLEIYRLLELGICSATLTSNFSTTTETWNNNTETNNRSDPQCHWPGQRGGFETLVLLRLARERLWLFGRPAAVSTHDPRKLRHGVADARKLVNLGTFWDEFYFFCGKKVGDQEDEKKLV